MNVHVWIGIGTGGALGALARYGVTVGMANLLGPGFPWGTLAANLFGTLALGFVAAWNELSLAPQALRLGLSSGLLGAFTTFSTFQFEALTYLRQGQWRDAFLYLGASLLFGLFLAWLGFTLGHILLLRPFAGGDGV